VFDDSLGYFFPACIRHAHIVLLCCPIDSHVPLKNLLHRVLLSTRPSVLLRRPCTGTRPNYEGSVQTPHRTCHTNPHRGAGPGLALATPGVAGALDAVAESRFRAYPRLAQWYRGSRAEKGFRPTCFQLLPCFTSFSYYLASPASVITLLHRLQLLPCFTCLRYYIPSPASVRFLHFGRQMPRNDCPPNYALTDAI
jgi:hypothetical protein